MEISAGVAVRRLGTMVIVEEEEDIVEEARLVMEIEVLRGLMVVVVVVGITMALRRSWRGKEIVAVGGDMEAVIGIGMVAMIGREGDRAVAVLTEGEVDIDGIMHFEEMYYLKAVWQEKVVGNIVLFSLVVCVC
mmetsp:Transcript_6251/g.11018  ORF Transcript_6251/g.11018 Transcript_6251/m.11018 type:complete len:134 (-) Transcript_6251:236-637(-)